MLTYVLKQYLIKNKKLNYFIIIHPITVDNMAENDKAPQQDELSSDDETLSDELLAQMLTNFSEKLSLEEPKRKTDTFNHKLTKDKLHLEGVAEGIKNGVFKNIIFMTGAGISVSAGIPDFRTPGTGLYSQLEKYNLDSPTDIFTLEYILFYYYFIIRYLFFSFSYFRKNPKPFNVLTKEMFPGSYKVCNYLVNLKCITIIL